MAETIQTRESLATTSDGTLFLKNCFLHFLDDQCFDSIGPWSDVLYRIQQSCKTCQALLFARPLALMLRGSALRRLMARHTGSVLH